MDWQTSWELGSLVGILSYKLLSLNHFFLEALLTSLLPLQSRTATPTRFVAPPHCAAAMGPVAVCRPYQLTSLSASPLRLGTPEGEHCPPYPPPPSLHSVSSWFVDRMYPLCSSHAQDERCGCLTSAVTQGFLLCCSCCLDIFNQFLNKGPWIFSLHWALQIMLLFHAHL